MAADRQQQQFAQKYGRKYGVDPKLLLAIAGHETGFGTLGAGRQGYTLGYGVTDSGILNKYQGVENQYRYAASTLAGWGAHTLQDVLAGKAAPYATDPHWEQGVASSYRNLGGVAAGAGATAAPAQAAPAAAPAPRRISPRVLQAVNESLATGSKQIPDQALDAVNRRLIQLPAFVGKTARQQRQPPQESAAAGVSPSSAQNVSAAKGGLAEAFYDPLGSYDQGQFGGPIGNHSDHVHLSITDPNTMLAAIQKARSFGLHVGENPYTDRVDPVHVKGSFHYQDFPGQYNGRKLGEAIDVSGDPASMARYYKWATRTLR